MRFWLTANSSCSARVERVRAQELGDLDDGVLVDEQGAEDRLLGLDGLRRKAVEGHGDSRAGSGTPQWCGRGGPRRKRPVHQMYPQGGRCIPGAVDGLWTIRPPRAER